MISREELIQEYKLREYVRTAIKIVKERRLAKNKTKGQVENSKLENLITPLIQKEIYEMKDKARLNALLKTLISEKFTPQPNRSTGINELDSLLHNIIPQIQPEYEQMGTSPEQRKDFQAYFLKAAIITLATISKDGVPNLEREIPGLESIEEQKFSIEIDEEDADKFIPVRDEDFAAEEEEKEEVEEVEEEEKELTANEKTTDEFRKEYDIQDELEDDTGLKYAARAWNQVRTNIIDSFSLLGNPEDRKEFYEYFITNMRLYFDLFEASMSPEDDEELPTTPEYEQEKDDIESAYEPETETPLDPPVEEEPIPGV